MTTQKHKTESTASHTPGPWKLAYTPKWQKPYIVDSNGQNIFRTQIPTEEQVANARLIAAAPESLEALEDLLAHIEDLASDFAICKEIADSSYGQAARATIRKAKATGRTA